MQRPLPLFKQSFCGAASAWCGRETPPLFRARGSVRTHNHAAAFGRTSAGMRLGTCRPNRRHRVPGLARGLYVFENQVAPGCVKPPCDAIGRTPARPAPKSCIGPRNRSATARMAQPGPTASTGCTATPPGAGKTTLRRADAPGCTRAQSEAAGHRQMPQRCIAPQRDAPGKRRRLGTAAVNATTVTQLRPMSKVCTATRRTCKPHPAAVCRVALRLPGLDR